MSESESPSSKRATSVIGSVAAFVLLGALLCASFLAGFDVQRRQERRHFSAQPYPFGLFWESWDLVERFFYGGPPSPQARTYGAINGALASLGDPYTVLITDTSTVSVTIQARTLITAGVGYIAVGEFGPHTGVEIRSATERLQADGVDALILDLRGTTGGYLTATLTALDQFLDGGTAFYAVWRDGSEQMFTAGSGGSATDVPLTVLIDGSTAGTAEVIAGTLQERRGATLIGETTAGVGTAQVSYRLSDGSTLYLTAAALLTADRRAVGGVGISPDVSTGTGDALKTALGFR